MRTLLLLAVVALARPAAADEPVVLERNAEKTLSVKHLLRIFSEEPEIADVKMLGHDEFVVKGKRAGKTTLDIWVDGGGQRFIEVEVHAPPKKAPVAP